MSVLPIAASTLEPEARGEALWAECRRGRFRRVLREIELLRRHGTTPQLHAVRAAALAVVGRWRDAETLARQTLTRPDISDPWRIVCCHALGECAFALGEFGSASEWFDRALRTAAESQLPDLFTFSRLKLLAFVCDACSPEALESHLAEARLALTRAAHPLLIAQYCRCLARIEATRGDIDRAEAHVAEGLRALGEHPCLYWEVRLLNTSVAVHILRGQCGKGLALAKRVGKLAQEAGDFEMLAASEVSSVDLLRRLGQLDAANGLLQRHLRRDLSPTMRLSALDEQVLFAATRRDMETARVAATELEELLERSGGSVPGWYDFVRSNARATFLLLSGDTAAAIEVLDEAIARATQQQDRYWAISLNLLLCKALVEERRYDDADRRAAAILEMIPPGLASAYAELAAIRARTAIARGALQEARLHLELGLRVAREFEELEVAGRLAEQYERLSGSEAAGLTGGFGVRADSGTRGGESVAPPAPISELEVASALLALRTRPRLLGDQLAAILEAFDLASGCALVAFPEDNGQPQLLGATGWDSESAPVAARDLPPSERIELGRADGFRYELLVRPPDDPLRRLRLAALRTLVRAALDLRRAELTNGEGRLIWPDPGPVDRDEDAWVSPAMRDVLRTARRVAPLPVPVLLTGETGTGKEVVARFIHSLSPRAGGPFVAFNCSAVPRELVESQLFGHRRGAFTGAERDFAGVVRAAAGGTLFLDEIADLPLDLQPKLLRLLDAGEIQPLGEARPVNVDARIVAATNAPLETLVRDRRFRVDLFYRLRVVALELPPLRRRREEIPLLAWRFLHRSAEEYHKGRLRLADETMACLLRYEWPGNVRQLSNEMRRVAALAEPDSAIGPELLSPEIAAAGRPAAPPPLPDETIVRLDQPLTRATAMLERLMVLRALEVSQGRVEEAARRLGLSRKGLFLKRRRLGLVPPRRSGAA